MSNVRLNFFDAPPLQVGGFGDLGDALTAPLNFLDDLIQGRGGFGGDALSKGRLFNGVGDQIAARGLHSSCCLGGLMRVCVDLVRNSDDGRRKLIH